MTTKPSHRHAAIALLAFVLASPFAYSQGARKKNRDAKSPVQSVAIEALESASYELQEVEDLATRVALTEGIIELLAGKRPERCRQLLESLFGDALKPDRAAAPGVLRKIIAVAADYDPKLAQNFAERYASSKETDGERAASPFPLRADVYLGLAFGLIEKNPALAVSAAEKSLTTGVYPRTLVFLERLRQKDAQLANKFLSSALASILSRQGKDINELLMLYPYAFSSERVPYAESGSQGFIEIAEYRSVARKRPVDSAAATQFLQAAAQVILNPARLETGPRQLAAGVEGDLYFLQLVEPLVQTYLPVRAAAFTAHRALLLQYLSQNQRESLQASFDHLKTAPDGTPTATKESSTVEEQLRRAEETTDPAQRDRIYFDAASKAVSEQRYDAALDIVDKMSDATRDAARPLVLFEIALNEIKEGRLEKAEEIAMRDGDRARRAFLLNVIARAAAQGENRDLNKATALLNEVEIIAGKLDAGAEKVSTLAGASTVFAGFENVRSAELFREAIKAANKLEKFEGDAPVNRAIEFGGFWYVFDLYDDKLTFPEAVRRQGQKDFYTALSDVQNLKNRVARLTAIIELCRAALSRPQAPRSE